VATAWPEIASQFLAAANSELVRVSRISRQILAFNRESRTQVEIRVSEILEDVPALNNRAVVEKKLKIERNFETSLLILGFPAQLRQVFSNLVRNAIEASFTGGRLRVKISASKLGRNLDQRAVRVTIADNGRGIPVENRKRVFDAFFTTKGPERFRHRPLAQCFDCPRTRGTFAFMERYPTPPVRNMHLGDVASMREW
jgi:two-component system, NtrC family, sensor kinase